MYDFSNLSPIDFEDLVRDILQKKLKIRMESFRAGKDLGIDFRFALGSDSCIIQAKHYLRSGEAALVSAARSENAKVKKLNPGRYIFVTSLPMSANLKNKIISDMPSAPLKSEDIIGQEDLNAYLLDFPDVEKAHFKLWLGSSAILEKIINSGIYNRTETELHIIKEMIPKFVQNNSVDQAESILKVDGTLIIAGDPGVGKTTLARILVSLHMAQGWEIHVVDDIEEAFKVANKGNDKLILFDDFLGQVRLSPDHVRGLDQRLPPFLNRVRANKNIRFILTTRELILNQAFRLSQKISSSQLLDRKYILDVGKYTRDVKAKIFYNHLYFSGLSAHQIDSILEGDFYIKVIDHKNFNPRLIEILTSDDYRKTSNGSFRDIIDGVLANPDQLWERPYRDHIGEDERSMMLALLVSPATAPFASLRSTFGRVSAALDKNFPAAQAQSRFVRSLKELEGAMIAISNRTARFSNPGLRDYLQSVIIGDDILLTIVCQLETFDEIRQAWTIFSNQTPSILPQKSHSVIWLAAAERMLDSVANSPISRLELVLEINDNYYCFDDLHNAVLEATNQLAAADVDQDDGLGFVYLLENIQMHLVPSEIQEKLHNVATSAACKYLVDNAGMLSFEEITGIYDALMVYGSDQLESLKSVHVVIDHFIDNIDGELSGFGAVEEVDDFEGMLKDFIKKTNYKGQFPEYDVMIRKEKLAIRENERRFEGRYDRPAGHSSSKIDDSTSEIKSMFESLKTDPE